MLFNPFLGVFVHGLGGLASGGFCAPYKGAKKWFSETSWLSGGFFPAMIAHDLVRLANLTRGRL